MARPIARREFLKTASAAAGAMAYAAGHPLGEIEAQVPGPANIQLGGTPYTPIPDYPIRPIRHSAVALTDTFWKPKVATNATVTIPFEVQKLTENGRTVSGNVLEAAILSLETHPDPALQAQVDAAVAAMAARPGGGNNGFEVAAAYFTATGKRDLIDRAIAAADALYADFTANDPPFSGGERDAINCVQLYRVTHDKKHLDLAKHYLDIRGLENSVNRSRHNQSYKPVLQQSEAVGHAVNCVSLMVSLADVGVLTGLTDYFDAARRMWTDAVSRKMYITGGVGSTGNEGFGEAYSLPNISAYSETCAVLMFITLNHRLFLATGDSAYVDVMERGMYNNAIDGVSASGDHFFYVNRLASAGDGRDLRWQRASLECCPPNLVRFLAGMPGFIYAQDHTDAIYVNLYVSSDSTFNVSNKTLGLSVESDLPWGGRSRLTISTKDRADVPGTIKLRIPGWARNIPAPGALYRYVNRVERQHVVAINNRQVIAVPDKQGYVSLDRTWKHGDVVEVDFPMPPRRVVADQRVKADVGRTAIERGPIVYCAEWPDVEGHHVLDLVVDADRALSPAVNKDLDGVTVLRTEATSVTNPALPARYVELIPYHLWANRGAGEMNLWLLMREYKVGDTGPSGGWIFYENPNYAKDGWRYLEAAPVDQSAGAKWGCFRTPITGARSTGIGSGKQNTQDILSACSDRDTAAALCAAYTLNGVGGWFLPSRDELAQLYKALRAPGLVDFGDASLVDNFSYWASSQQTTDMATHIDFADNGRQHSDDKDFPRRVRAIRAF